jgi:hypothetical protein
MFKRAILWVAVAGLVLALEASAGAAVITVPDASFEIPVLSPGGYEDIASANYTGPWKCDSGDAWVDYGYWRSEGYLEDLYAHSGNNKAYAYEDSIYQILGETFVEGLTYTLSVWVGQPWEGSDSGWSLYFTGEDYKNNLIQTSGTAGLTWGQVSLQYTATAADAGKKIGIKMYGDTDVSFDDVTLDAIPEPATLALLGLGGLSVLLGRKRK